MQFDAPAEKFFQNRHPEDAGLTIKKSNQIN